MRFWRRRRGRGLGAAVTAIPSGPAPAAAAPVPAPVAPPPAAVPSGPRIELGFRDGSTASLDPSSEQAKALVDLARVLRG